MPPLTGRIVGKEIMNNLLSGGLQLEILYSFIIIACSLMIYFGTKEIYELTGHKGIKYFRLSFLFFAIAYFFRSFIKFIIIYFNSTRILEISPQIFGMLTLFIFIYFNSLAIFYLLYSCAYKKINIKKIFLHLISILFAGIIILTANPLIYLIINIILLIVLIIIVYIGKTKSKIPSIYSTYFLLLIFWILNILDILIPDFIKTFKLFIYISSAGIFLTILYKVLRKVGN